MNSIGRYEVRQLIGGGAMGQVWLAHDPVIQRNVAVKTLDRTRLPANEVAEMAARFRREAVAAGRLTHPNIVTVYEYGEAEGLSYIAMEHAAGRSLREVLAGQGPLQAPALLVLARQLFAALIYAHEQGIWHRDLKPGNIVVVGEVAAPATLQAKVLDFGIARIESAASLTQAGTVVGTPGYMSPEQYLGETVDARTDIYALGVTLFEMVTGARTFQGGLAEVMDQVVHSVPPPASALRPGLPAALDAALAKALARDPAARFASMRAFREAFVDALVDHQQAAPPAAADAAQAPSPAPFVAAHEPATLRQSHAGSLPRRPLPAPAGARPKILFVDDEERILGALSALFRLRYDVLATTDGHEALKLVREHRPLVIVSDQRMPRMAGIDFLRQSREIDPGAVRILLTGYSDLAAIVGSINDGEVFRFVNKPWSNQEMRDTIAQAVEIASATRLAAAGPEPAVPEASEAQRAGEAILVAQRGRELFDQVTHAFGRTRPVCHAADIAAVLQAVEDQPVAVLLCDMDAFDEAAVMLKSLKQVQPQIQAIALSRHSDSDRLVALINQAQLFRFLNHPVPLGLLDRSLRSAITAHARTQARPVLARRQQVEAAPEVAQSSLGRQILQRLSLFIRPPRVTLQGAKGA